MKADYFSSPDEILKKLNFITPVTAAYQQFIIANLKTIRLPKKHLLLEEGEVCKNVYFVFQGSLRSFFLNRNGKECTGWFAKQGDLVMSPYSYFGQQPAKESIETIEECVLQYLSWQQMQVSYAEFKEANHIGRIILQQYYMKTEKSGFLLRNPEPKYRYRMFLEEYPEMVQKATQQMIASYIGIAPETLSRLRSSGEL